jgi:uroporphyrinogen-III synthase
MNLQGITVLVTRPQHQAQNLTNLIQKYAGTVLLLPTLHIQTLQPDLSSTPKIVDKMIFVSANAVTSMLPYLSQFEIASFVAIGAKTAQTLAQYDLNPIIAAAAPYDSETLLQHSQLQNVAKQQIIIVRGLGGRELLATTLQQRQANVCYINVYMRTKPDINIDWLQTKHIDIILVSSAQGVENLFAMLENQAWVYNTPIIAMSARVTEVARQYSQAKVYTAKIASDEGLLATLMQWKLHSAGNK